MTAKNIWSHWSKMTRWKIKLNASVLVCFLDIFGAIAFEAPCYKNRTCCPFSFLILPISNEQTNRISHFFIPKFLFSILVQKKRFSFYLNIRCEGGGKYSREGTKCKWPSDGHFGQTVVYHQAELRPSSCWRWLTAVNATVKSSSTALFS